MTYVTIEEIEHIKKDFPDKTEYQLINLCCQFVLCKEKKNNNFTVDNLKEVHTGTYRWNV